MAAFIFLFVFGFLWYGTLMRGAHEEVQALFRTKPDFPWLILGHIVMAFFFTMLCVRFVPAGGLGASATLGILVGISIRRAAFDLVRGPTVDDEDPLRLDRGCRDPIRDCRRNCWRDLQTQLTRDQ